MSNYLVKIVDILIKSKKEKRKEKNGLFPFTYN